MRVRSHHVRGLTMIELLVALAILAFTLGGVVSIFFAGTRLGMRAQDEAEAGRIASAVYSFLDSGDSLTIAVCGRDNNGNVSSGTLLSGPATAQVVDSTRTDNLGVQVRFPIVWQATVDAVLDTEPDFDGLAGMHYVTINVFADEDGSDSVTVDDRQIGSFRSVLASRAP